MKLSKANITFFILLILLFGYSVGHNRVLDKKTVPIKAEVRPYTELRIEPETIVLHEIGKHILYSNGYVKVSVQSNSPFVINFQPSNPNGYISKDEHSLETYYIILPIDAPDPYIDDYRWIRGDMLAGYIERPSDYGNYVRKIFVKVVKNNPPYGKKDFSDIVRVNIKINDEISFSGTFQVLYK